MSGCFKTRIRNRQHTSLGTGCGNRFHRSGLLSVLLVASGFAIGGPAVAGASDASQAAPSGVAAPLPVSKDTQLTALKPETGESGKAKNLTQKPKPGENTSRKTMPDSVIVDAREYPWSAIGRLNTGGRGYCTGILVDAYYVLTDAHCLFYRTEGRWWQPNELHFVAGYQRDTNLAHARVTGYELAPGYRAHGGVSLASILNNWALVKLEKPLGHQAGWLGLKNLDKKLVQRLKKGHGALLQAGYRRNAPHAVTLGLDCGPKGFFAAENRIGHRCQLKPGRADLPFLVFMDGKFNLVANHVISSITRQPPRTGPLASARFRARLTRGESRAPETGAMASPVPLGTISSLLETLGHTKGAETSRQAQARKTAIQSFEVSEGMPVTGKASLTLLGKILETAY